MAYDGYRSQRCAPLGSTAPWAIAGALHASEESLLSRMRGQAKRCGIANRRVSDTSKASSAQIRSKLKGVVEVSKWIKGFIL